MKYGLHDFYATYILINSSQGRTTRDIGRYEKNEAMIYMDTIQHCSRVNGERYIWLFFFSEDCLSVTG